MDTLFDAEPSRSRFLVADDNAERRKYFFNVLREYGDVDLVLDPYGAITKLGLKAYDCAYLDHDFGLATADAPTGRTIAAWMVTHQPQVRKVVIHSSNFPASSAMAEELRRAGFDVMNISFPTFKALVEHAKKRSKYIPGVPQTEVRKGGDER